MKLSFFTRYSILYIFYNRHIAVAEPSAPPPDYSSATGEKAPLVTGNSPRLTYTSVDCFILNASLT